MEKIIISNLELPEDFVFEPGKIVALPVSDTGSISDGYHTFDELYEHRITLWIALCKKHDEAQDGHTAFGEEHGNIADGSEAKSWRSKLHSDGTCYEGWFSLGIGKEPGKQISYHLPLSRWDETDFAETLERGPEFDGHTPADVLKRIAAL